MHAVLCQSLRPNPYPARRTPTFPFTRVRLDPACRGVVT